LIIGLNLFQVCQEYFLMKFVWNRLLFAIVVVASICLPTWGAATLQVGSGCVSGCSGDPNFSGQHASSIDIWDSSGGQAGADPTLLIIGVPNVTGQGFFNSGLITSAFVSTSPATPVTSQYGTLAPSNAGSIAYGVTTAGYYGNFTSATGKDVYSFLNLTANASQNYTNWSCVDLPAGSPSCSGVLNAGQGFISSLTGFGIYAFTINAAVPSKGYIHVNLSSESALPEGSYVIAYSGNLGVAFTNTGLQDVLTTPEPIFRTLLGGGMVLMALILAIRKRVAAQA
jgi:hypothetical protein